MRLLDRLREMFPDSSARARKQWLGAGRVRVNGEVARRGDAEARAEDRVELGPPSATFPAALRLVHEDEDVIVIDKPPGLLTIATADERQRTAYRMLSEYLSWQGRGAARGPRLFIVHRLDRETSGLICFAKSAAVKEALQAQFGARDELGLQRLLDRGGRTTVC